MNPKKSRSWTQNRSALPNADLFNVLAHWYQKHRKNDLIEAKQIAHLNRSIYYTVLCRLKIFFFVNQQDVPYLKLDHSTQFN